MKETDSTTPPPMRPEDLDKVRALFARSAEQLDVATTNRLRVMRRDALTADAPGEAAWRWPTGILAASLLVAALTWMRPSSRQPQVAPVAESAPPEDAALAVADDAELYAWLGEGPVAVDASPGESL